MPNGKVPTRPEWWDVYPGEAYPYEEAAKTELLGKYESAFWEWAGKTYSMADVDILRASDITRTAQWSYFLRNVYGLRPEHPDYPGAPEPTRLPRGRPQAEKYGLTETDWLVLMKLSGSPARVQKELQTWLDTGYINQYQARDIWTELDTRVRRAAATLLATGYTEAEWPAEYQRRIAERERAKELEEWGPMRGPPAGVAGRAEALEKARERRRRIAAFEAYRPSPRYEAAFEEERAGLEGPQPWRTWFERQYPTLVGRFKAKLPKFEARFYPGLEPEEAEKEIEESWAEILRKRKPELREEYAAAYPFGVGARPWAMAPRIQTVRF